MNMIFRLIFAPILLAKIVIRMKIKDWTYARIVKRNLLNGLMTEKGELNEKQLDNNRSGSAGYCDRDTCNSAPTRAEERGVGNLTNSHNNLANGCK